MGKKAWNMGDRRLSGNAKFDMFIGAVVAILFGAGLFISSSDIRAKVVGAICVLAGLARIFGIRF